MKEVVAEHQKEFEELVGSLAHSTNHIQDPVAIGLMLYSIAEERKSTNLIVKELNAKIDGLVSKIAEFEKQPAAAPAQPAPNMSDRDQEVLSFVRTTGKVSAEQMQKKFKYRGKNAASARLSKLFHEGILQKEYAGRRVYYKVR
ncbi:MAG: hypothetical protein V1875_06805 [Candidatus Altiarchaeota archaeon]